MCCELRASSLELKVLVTVLGRAYHGSLETNASCYRLFLFHITFGILINEMDNLKFNSGQFAEPECCVASLTS